MSAKIIVEICDREMDAVGSEVLIDSRIHGGALLRRQLRAAIWRQNFGLLDPMALGSAQPRRAPETASRSAMHKYAPTRGTTRVPKNPFASRAPARNRHEPPPKLVMRLEIPRLIVPARRWPVFDFKHVAGRHASIVKEIR